MTWRGLWEGIASLFENVLFVPLDAMRNLELDSWWAANFVSWIFLIITFIALFYWLRKLVEFNEPTENTYTFKEEDYFS